MILDTVIESGNPADSSRLLPMIKRLNEVYGKLPNQVAAAAGYASKTNIDATNDYCRRFLAHFYKAIMRLEILKTGVYG